MVVKFYHILQIYDFAIQTFYNEIRPDSVPNLEEGLENGIHGLDDHIHGL